MRRATTVLLLVFVAVSVVWAYARPARDETPVSRDTADDAQLVVYYLHGARRCATCVAIEEGTRRAVTTAFAEEVDGGRIALFSFDTEQPDHAHFVTDFALVSSSVVVASSDGSSFRVLDRVWQLVGDDTEFDAYVVEAVRDAAEGRW